jgi:hypothetical protein
MRRLLGFLTFLLFAYSGASHSTAVQTTASQCDVELARKAPADHPFKYRSLGDRCEGIYVENVRCTALLVASLTESLEDYDLRSGKDLALEWTAPTNVTVQLRAHALKPRLYYRMDTVRPAGEKSFRWASDVLRALDIRKSDVGIIGWTDYAMDGTNRRVYLPLRVSQQTRPNRTFSYQLILVPCHELKEVFITLSKVGRDSQAGKLKEGEPLRHSYFAAGRGIMIPITNLKGQGFYHLQIGANLREGGSTATEIWFYHSGN